MHGTDDDIVPIESGMAIQEASLGGTDPATNLGLEPAKLDKDGAEEISFDDFSRSRISGPEFRGLTV